MKDKVEPGYKLATFRKALRVILLGWFSKVC